MAIVQTRHSSAHSPSVFGMEISLPGLERVISCRLGQVCTDSLDSCSNLPGIALGAATYRHGRCTAEGCTAGYSLVDGECLENVSI